MAIEWPPIPLYIAFAVVATWSSVLGAELRREYINPVEERGLSMLRHLLQWGGVVSAVHLLGYLFLACYKAIFAKSFVSLFSIAVHIVVMLAVMTFMTSMFTISFKRTRQT